MYESPIEKIVQHIQENLIKQEEDHLMAQITETVGYQINKEELIKALKYDRNQYHIGFEDARKMYERAKGEWIPVTERLPEEKKNPITQDFYEYQCTFKSDDVYDVRSYKFGKGHWWHGCGIVDEYVIAWMPKSEPYKEEVEHDS